LHITEFEFFLLIHNCAQINFNHQSKFSEFVPGHLGLPKIPERLDEVSMRQVSKKILGALQERKRIHAHLFERDSQWHCFYFSYSDIPSDATAHWKHGDHLHYVNYLWPSYNKERILAAFDTRKTKVSDKLHIRFSPFEFSESLPSASNIPLTIFGEQPMLMAINANLPDNPNIDPVAIAQLATRGLWVASISTLT
jgi:hypothetical protein